VSLMQSNSPAQSLYEIAAPNASLPHGHLLSAKYPRATFSTFFRIFMNVSWLKIL
jgi:hypothetical protein